MSTGNPQFNPKPNLHETIMSPDNKIQHKGKSDEEVFQRYIEELKLKPENLGRKILEVGDESSKFGKYVNEHYADLEVFSLDPLLESNEEAKTIKGIVESIPFEDETFNLVISNGAIPNMLQPLHDREAEEAKERVHKGLFEMTRITKPGGEIRLGSVIRIVDPLDSQFVSNSILDTTLEELKQVYGVEIEEIHTPPDTYRYDEPFGEPKELFAKSYLIIIRKPVNPRTENKPKI